MIQKGNYELKILYESDLQSASKEHVYRIGFYMIPYIRAYIWSWHTSNTKNKPYIKRNIPVYDLVSNEVCEMIEENALTILEEIGIKPTVSYLTKVRNAEESIEEGRHTNEGKSEGAKSEKVHA